MQGHRRPSVDSRLTGIHWVMPSSRTALTSRSHPRNQFENGFSYSDILIPLPITPSTAKRAHGLSASPAISRARSRSHGSSVRFGQCLILQPV